MRRWLAALGRVLPRRRQRHWRYVSGRRRRIGWALFASLVLVAYGYGHLTGDARVRGEVERYLADLTGGQVKVRDAHFGLFSGIRVSGVRVWLPDGVDATFFESPQVRLVHNPWTLLLRRRLEPTEIVCVRPKVRLVEDVKEGKLTVLRIFPLPGRTGAPDERRPLPTVRLRDVELVRIDLEEGQLLPVGRWERLSVLLEPDPKRQIYRLFFEGPPDAKPPVRGRGTVHVATGETHTEGLAGLQGLDDALPRKYRRWRRQWKLAGKVRWVGDARVGTLSSADDLGQLNQLTVELEDVSMELPPKQGALKLEGVKGTVVFFRDSIEIKKLKGTIAKAGKAVFELDGGFEGYNLADPFQIRLRIKELTFPFGGELFEAWGEKYARFHKQLAPAGPVNVSATLWRKKVGQKLQVKASARLCGVSLRMPGCPIRVDRVEGGLVLANDALVLSRLTGRHGSAEVVVTGTVSGDAERPAYDVVVTARALPFTQEVHDALPVRYRKLWQAFSPRGRADFEVRVHRGLGEKAKESRTLTIDLGGEASIEYARFPYRLERVEGRVEVGATGGKFRSLKGWTGPMSCRLSGDVVRSGGHYDVDVTIEEISNLPLDERLARALPGTVRPAYRACGLSGFADVPRAKLTRTGGRPVAFTIPVALRDATITHQAFPFPISRAGGELTLTRGKAVIHHLVGAHGRAKVSISGKTLLEAGRQVLDLELDATELSLDAELRRSLPAAARRWWELLDPAGVADVVLTLRTTLTPPKPRTAKTRPSPPAGTSSRPAGRPAYHLLVRPRDMRILYRHFPYLLRKVTGTVEIVPGKMTLTGVKALAEGDAAVALDGEVLVAGGREHADLKVTTAPVAIDRRLLDALPGGLVGALRLVAGGTAELDLDELRVWRAAPAASRPAGRGAPASAPARAAATRPARQLAWRSSGAITLRDAAMDLGFGGKRVTGTIRGRMGCAGPPETLQASAGVTLSDFVVGSRRLGKITAAVHKDARSPTLDISDLTGQTFGGLVAGFAKVRLVEPRRYVLSLSVENISLKQFLDAGRKDARRGYDVAGLLTGKLQMTAVPGDDASRRASGELHITKAKLYRLPVLLGFLHVVFLTLPGESAFDSADVDYYLRGRTLVFREIHLGGPALSMLGAGTMDMKTERLKLTFLTGPPRKLPRLAALSEFLEGLTIGLSTVRVTGTLNNPKTRSTPFRDVDKTLREIHNPEGR